ncbi:hypothetical protein GW17_00021752 [Ensete ventricosum]|nr:hypothetical protein GW17_00021752 [Ensete ventricosum]
MGREKVEEEEDEGRRGGNQRGCGGDAGGHQFLDRSKVRILLCDNDPKSSQEVLQLLYKCSYQESLNYEGSPLAGNMEGCNNKLVQENYTSGNGSVTRENICNTKDFETPPECPVPYPSSSTEQNEGTGVSGVPSVFPFPLCYPEVMNQNIIMSSSGQMFQGSLNDVQAHPTSAMLPQYAVVPYMPLMPSFPCQPLGTNPQSSHMAAPSMWSSMTSSSTPEVKSGRTEIRAAALVKFRQKRKERRFDKKIRYVKRKRLAEKRPRVRGQFVKQVDNVDLSHYISSGDGDSEDDEADEPTSKELELISSPRQDASY